MVLSQWAPLLLEAMQTITVTLGIDGLDLQADVANYRGSGVEHSQHALVSETSSKANHIL